MRQQHRQHGAPAGNVFLHDSITVETRAASSRSGNSANGVTLSRQAAYVAYGAANTLDARTASTGIFSHFTSLARAWWWFD